MKAEQALLNLKVYNRKNPRETFDLAIDALEKQIPKKAMDYKCPTCGKKFCTEMWEVDYCCSCGQRLKWEEGENK